MLLKYIGLFSSRRVILASSSPRRLEILSRLGFPVLNVCPSTFEENLDKSKYSPDEYVRENAKQKALDVYRKLSDKNSCLVIGSDTVVVRIFRYFLISG